MKRNDAISRIVKPVSHEAVVRAMRQEIIDGKLQPGVRLPTYDQLQRRFATTRMTIHRACERLIASGYVHSRPKIGTYVAEFPPHLHRYGIVFPGAANREGWTSYWDILQSAAQSIASAEPPKEILPFHEIRDHSNAPDFLKLMSDIDARRLAGLILLAAPHNVMSTSLYGDCPVPRVYIGADIWWRYHIPSVSPDMRSFVGRALEYAAGQSPAGAR